MANPKKPAQIEAILRRNKEKLLVFLKNFHNDKEDEQFSVSISRTWLNEPDRIMLDRTRSNF